MSLSHCGLDLAEGPSQVVEICGDLLGGRNVTAVRVAFRRPYGMPPLIIDQNNHASLEERLVRISREYPEVRVDLTQIQQNASA